MIHGRCDAVLNPGGVRIGTAEIYRQVEQLDEVVEGLVIGQDWQGDVRIVLFVRLRDGLVLDDALRAAHPRAGASASRRRVTCRRGSCRFADIPRTRSGKIVELAVRDVVHGRPVREPRGAREPRSARALRGARGAGELSDETPIVAVHGGAGSLPAAAADPQHAARAREGLLAALRVASQRLCAGAPALDAVVAAVRELEDCEVFNAGRGCVLDADGQVGLDAAVMQGAVRRAGGVIGVRRIAHPVEAAEAVLRDGRHVLLAGEGAERFALEAGLAQVEPEHHVTPQRREQQQALRGARSQSGGTVGAVALDANGRLAVATSTGGIAGRRPGRVSDSALFGAGSWADDVCAVSATGWGEFFIRAGFAYEISARIRLGGRTLAAACDEALARVAALGGSGGCIAIDSAGRVAMRFDTPDMPRGACVGAGPPRLAVHGRGELEAADRENQAESS